MTTSIMSQQGSSLHIHRGTICCNVNLTDHIKKKRLFNSRILKQEGDAALKGIGGLEHDMVT